MNQIKSKVSPPQSLKELGEEIIAYAKTKATKEDIAFFRKELEEMKAMLEEGKKRHSKKIK